MNLCTSFISVYKGILVPIPDPMASGAASHFSRVHSLSTPPTLIPHTDSSTSHRSISFHTSKVWGEKKLKSTLLKKWSGREFPFAKLRQSSGVKELHVCHLQWHHTRQRHTIKCIQIPCLAFQNLFTKWFLNTDGSLFCLHVLICVFIYALPIFVAFCPLAWHQVIFYTRPGNGGLALQSTSQIPDTHACIFYCSHMLLYRLRDYCFTAQQMGFLHSRETDEMRKSIVLSTISCR